MESESLSVNTYKITRTTGYHKKVWNDSFIIFDKLTNRTLLSVYYDDFSYRIVITGYNIKSIDIDIDDNNWSYEHSLFYDGVEIVINGVYSEDDKHIIRRYFFPYCILDENFHEQASLHAAKIDCMFCNSDYYDELFMNKDIYRSFKEWLFPFVHEEIYEMNECEKDS